MSSSLLSLTISINGCDSTYNYRDAHNSCHSYMRLRFRLKELMSLVHAFLFIFVIFTKCTCVKLCILIKIIPLKATLVQYLIIKRFWTSCCTEMRKSSDTNSHSKILVVTLLTAEKTIYHHFSNPNITFTNTLKSPTCFSKIASKISSSNAW